MKRVIGTAVLALLCTAAHAAAQTTVFVVRHAERADQAQGAPAMMASDPDLSAEGKARAESLAAILMDAGIKTILVTEFKRTQQTAEPLAKALNVTPEVVSAKDGAALIRKIKSASGNVLVVGHSNSVPAVLKDLGITPAVEIADTEFNNLFVVSLGDQPSMVRLRYRHGYGGRVQPGP